MTDRDIWDQADEAWSERKEADAAEHFARVDALAAFPIDDLSRHVLIVEPSGAAYIAPHLGEKDRCAELHAAWVTFSHGWNDKTAAPGRYWCSVEDDGNFSIGGRLPELVTA